ESAGKRAEARSGAGAVGRPSEEGPATGSRETRSSQSRLRFPEIPGGALGRRGLMFVDASVIVAIVNEEDDAAAFIDRLQGHAGTLRISALARFEAVQAAARKSADGRGERVTGEIIHDA